MIFTSFNEYFQHERYVTLCVRGRQLRFCEFHRLILEIPDRLYSPAHHLENGRRNREFFQMLVLVCILIFAKSFVLSLVKP